MNRADRRRFDKEYQKLLRADGDNCSFCRRSLEHNEKTFGGYSITETVALAGECCQVKLQDVLCSGIFLTRNTEPFITAKRSVGKAVPIEKIADVVQSMQNDAARLDGLTDNLMRQAGLPGHSQNVFLGATPWKADDAGWFEKNPKRSHRLRSLLEGEADSMAHVLSRIPVPPNHRIEILVRQIEVGKRVRTPFCRNISTSVPDVEEVIHALYDTVSQPGRFGVISVDEISKLSAKYADASVSRKQ